MEIILKKDVENLGLEFDTVNVKPGYARKATTVSIAAKVGTGDKIFGSINNATLAEELAKAGVEVDKKYIKIPGNTIKRTGKFSAKVRPHRNVEYDYEFEVVSDVVAEEANTEA